MKIKSNMDKKISFLDKSSLDSFFKLLDNAFPGEGPFDRTWPHACDRLEKNFKKHLIIKDKSKVISHVGLLPMNLMVDGSIIKVGGIGQVATHTDYRGQGLMNLLLNQTIRIMKEQEYDISWLAGDRKRYNSFGWENAGMVYRFYITDRTVKNINILKNINSRDFKVKFYKGENRYLKQIRDMHVKEKFGLKRNGEEYKVLFGGLKKETYLAVKNNKVLSYITIQKFKANVKNTKVREYGGDIEGLKFLIKYIVEKFKLEFLTVNAPVFFSKYREVLFECSSSWEIVSSGMIKIINLESLLKKFTNQMTKRLKSTGYKNKKNITLVISENNQSATLQVGESVKVIDKESSDRLVLSEIDMVRLLFGMSKPSDNFQISGDKMILDSIFPLNFFIWSLEKV
ncbi:MAG: GNAT family N-acetyltransferase [Elusimicrobia bacterium]|nr:GNAT family N-acetyltransferase [Elusimicrobiota bacterium]